ncbi:MAG: SDR family oxidoreductase [Sphingomonadaceae bacterium]|jgi:NAD(P)-dependent dehydrogenase (short-subunit alcohol dehydrogenase family)
MVSTTGRFVDRCVVILGGNAGIGLAAARLFRAEGAKLALTGRNAETLEAAAREVDGLGIRSDMGVLAESEAAMAEIGEALGGIDVLVVNAGVGGFAPVSEITEDFWDGIHDVNLKGAFFAIQKALPLMRDGGAIVITGSIGSLSAVPGNAAYAAAKAGIRAVARILAAELLPRKIRVNVVSPGPTDTEIFKRDASSDEIEGMREFFKTVVPEGRMGDSEEVAQAILFLASTQASFINGVDLYVDGGCIELKS